MLIQVITDWLSRFEPRLHHQHRVFHMMHGDTEELSLLRRGVVFTGFETTVTQALKLGTYVLGAPIRLGMQYLFQPQPISSFCLRRVRNEKHVLVSCGGGGIFFFWQLGAARAIVEERGKLSTSWAGSSAGALCAALSLCKVDTHKALKVAHQLAQEHSLYTRPMGVFGVWGAIVRQWLDILLPENAAELCGDGTLTVQITACRGWLKGLQVRRVSQFSHRTALIDALIASCHVPWLMNGKATTPFVFPGDLKPTSVCDGSFAWALPTRRLHGVTSADLVIRGVNGRQADYVITQTDDTSYRNGKGPDFAELLSYDAAAQMVEQGYRFTKRRIAL